MSELSPAAQAAADTFRALCAELTAWAEKTSAHYFQPPDVLLRARAALSVEPAVPEGREPVAVTGQLSDEELLNLAQQYSVVYLLSDGSACHPFQEGYDMRNDVLNFARAVLARWGHPAPPPADGEVAELVKELRRICFDVAPCDDDIITRAADLLQRLSPPQPVAVSERLPGPEDCLDEGWAWFFSPRVGWRQAVFPVSTAYTHWLPAHALPIPQQQKNAND